MRPATTSDTGQLVELMGEFYAESEYVFYRSRATKTFDGLLAHARLGRDWLIQADGTDVGYMVVTLGYSMEYGGLDAFIDDLFVCPAFRNAGLGSKAVEEARAYCICRKGLRALHLEAELSNAAATNLYRKAGFESNHKHLLTLRLSAHEFEGRSRRPLK